MINQVHVEGFVTKRVWRYNGDTFFRLAAYRDPDRERKHGDGKSAEGKDRPDYVTIRVPAALSVAPARLETRERVQVHGWLESREFSYSLAEFLQDARRADAEVDLEQARGVTTYRCTTWIVAERIVAMNGRNGNA
jgi:hypothetical protein